MKAHKERTSVVSAVVLCMLTVALAGAIQAQSQDGLGQPAVLSNAVVNAPIQFDVSPPLRDLPPQVSPPGGFQLIHPPLRPKLNKLQNAGQQGASAVTPALQASPSRPISPPTRCAQSADLEKEMEVAGLDVMGYDQKWHEYTIRITPKDFQAQSKLLGGIIHRAYDYANRD